jgi:hypothetical protein
MSISKLVEEILKIRTKINEMEIKEQYKGSMLQAELAL